MTEDKDNQVQQEINKAINFLGQNKFLEAENTCLKIIDSGDNADAYHILSSIKIYQQEFDDSIRYVKKSIEINDGNPGYHVTLGCAYSAKKDYDSSVIAFKSAIKINNKIAQVHFYLGESYRKLKKYNDAISSFYNTIEISPEHSAAHMLLGIVYQEKKQFDLSIKAFKKCIEIMPDYAEAHLNLGLCYLLIGDYKNGWKEYEWRRKVYSIEQDGLAKEWTGQNLENKTLLVVDEGSNENLIHFIRFVRELKKECCRIIVQCDEKARDLMHYQVWVDEVISSTDLPEHDYYIPIGSLMNVLDYNPQHNNQEFPYIDVSKKNIKFIKSGDMNIGLALQTDTNSSAHSEESIDPTAFRNIFGKEHNVIYFNSNIDEDNPPDLFSNIIKDSKLIDLAEIISQLDLVITVDHLVAHLAGALNINTILMLPCVPNWRWDMNYRDSTVWYKSFKVFRQQTPGDWVSVINKVTNHLSDMNNG
tara:strand:- start:809 stop:2233 length:1425 start_codon:yes stop_codon:yes gene_type:complete